MILREKIAALFLSLPMMAAVTGSPAAQADFPHRLVEGDFYHGHLFGFSGLPAPAIPRGMDWIKFYQGEPVFIEHAGLQIYISWLPSPREEDFFIPIVEILDAHLPAISMVFTHRETAAAPVSIAIAQLDPDMARPAILLRVVTGGAQCCAEHFVVHQNPQGAWEQTELPWQYSEFYYHPVPLRVNGVLQLVGVDANYQSRESMADWDAFPLRVFDLHRGVLEEWIDAADD